MLALNDALPDRRVADFTLRVTFIAETDGLSRQNKNPMGRLFSGKPENQNRMICIYLESTAVEKLCSASLLVAINVNGCAHSNYLCARPVNAFKATTSRQQQQ